MTDERNGPEENFHDTERKLRDRIEALTAERDEAKAMQECGCAYENPTDICAGHHALFERVYGVQRAVLEARLEAATHDAKEAEAYAEELEAEVKNLTKHHSNMADPRYWEGRYRDEKTALAKAVEVLRALSCKCPSNCDWERDDVCTSWTARAVLAEIEGGKDE